MTDRSADHETEGRDTVILSAEEFLNLPMEVVTNTGNGPIIIPEREEDRVEREERFVSSITLELSDLAGDVDRDQADVVSLAELIDSEE